MQIASLNVLIVIAGPFFEHGVECSTLPRGYDKIEEDDGDYDDDSEYYFEDLALSRLFLSVFKLR